MGHYEQMMEGLRPLDRLGADEGDGFWRKEEPGLLDGAVVKGGMWGYQREAWELPQFVKVFVGGYGSGKSLWLCKRAISSALENAPAPVAVVSPTFPMAKETTILTIKELCAGKESLYGRHFKWRYNASEHKFFIRFKGRSARIIVYSGERPEALKGPNLGAAYIDEPFIQDHSVFMQMLARVRHPAARLREICLAGTPEELNWGYDLCVENRTGLDVGLVQASTRGNKALSEDYVKTLETAYSEKAAKAYIDGQFVNLSEGMVYYGFDRFEHVRELGVPEGAEIGVGMDFNVNPMAAVAFWRAGNHMHLFKEFELPNSDTEEMCSTLREEFGDRLRYIYPDASGSARKTASPAGKSDFHYIREAGFQIKAFTQNPKRKDRYNATNGKFAPREGEPSLTVEPSCHNLIKYFSVYSHALMNKQEDMSHLLDAATYPVAFLFPVAKEALRVTTLQ